MIKKPLILTVSELTRDIKEVLEGVFVEVHVVGEVSNLSRPSSGHVYFSLKDDASSIRCVLFKGQALRQKFSFEDGLKVVCFGRVGVYERAGQYQFYAECVEPQGAGSLQLAFEQLKERLGKEGLFDEAHKRPLPYLPKTIGIVTSPTGAVIRDILHVLDRRFSQTHVIVNPVRVQGDEAVPEIVSAITDFNELNNVQVIIVARGGGSLEDLWCFNDERVARAIYNSSIPVVSAVGHETDYTIADFVADRRAPTPSAAAEIIMPLRAELVQRIESYLKQLWQNVFDIVPQNSQRIEELSQNLKRALSRKFENEELRLDGIVNQLNALNPLAILKRGYSVTTLLDTQKVLYSSGELKKGDKIRTRLFEGEFNSEVA